VPSFNQVTLLGNLTRDPEVKHLQSGTAVCDMGLAINERVKRGDDYVDEAVFVDVTLFGRTAEVAGEYLAKGALVLIAGRLKYEQWEKDGQKRSKLKVVADKLQMLGQRQRSEDSQERQERPQEQSQVPVGDEIPFSVIGWIVALVSFGGSFI
jgi:single-strand DNA-binding protein